ncbi:MAG: PAS domain-containing protein [Parvibaculum sp.]|uniref:PAS domain-containing protein n=1 Tax=Parvibaculum sp. TaxID=2024848 RepID=UPI002ABBBDC2|nr:PAS domain-containing protein [Parvibaculum sp.]MDZ4381512.1 PAS domain-containing protein [Parvibaculum sp.]
MTTKRDVHSAGGDIGYSVVEAGEPRHPHCRHFLEYWEARLQPDGVMLREDFNPLDMPHAMGGMYVVEPANGGADMRYRLVGNENEERVGHRFTGMLFSDCFSQEMAADQIALHNRVIETRKPAILRGYLIGVDLEHVYYEAIYLPVRTKNGDMQIVGGLYELPKDKG